MEPYNFQSGVPRSNNSNSSDESKWYFGSSSMTKASRGKSNNIVGRSRVSTSKPTPNSRLRRRKRPKYHHNQAHEAEWISHCFLHSFNNILANEYPDRELITPEELGAPLTGPWHVTEFEQRVRRRGLLLRNLWLNKSFRRLSKLLTNPFPVIAVCRIETSIHAIAFFPGFVSDPDLESPLQNSRFDVGLISKVYALYALQDPEKEINEDVQ
jgi:hypothetical protein